MAPRWGDLRASAGAVTTLFSSLQPIRFLLVGIGNTAVGLAIIYTLKWLGSTDLMANLSGYAICLAMSFVLNKKFTFSQTGAILVAAVRFLAVFAIAYAANIATVLTLIYYGIVDGYAAQALGILPYTTIFYVGSRYFAFRPRSFAG